MKPKVVLIGTGGTIASRFDPELGRTVASQRGEDLIRSVPQLAEIADLEIDDFATVSSFDMSVEFAHRLSGRINQQLARSEVSGVVVTHGTDTMEESCYLADLLLEQPERVRVGQHQADRCLVGLFSDPLQVNVSVAVGRDRDRCVAAHRRSGRIRRHEGP